MSMRGLDFFGQLLTESKLDEASQARMQLPRVSHTCQVVTVSTEVGPAMASPLSPATKTAEIGASLQQNEHVQR